MAREIVRRGKHVSNRIVLKLMGTYSLGSLSRVNIIVLKAGFKNNLLLCIKGRYAQVDPGYIIT